ncbi:MAG TPA: hypothetical protein PLN33_00765 [Hyphomonadaceae bacterium]|nr:hypothetical protein [Hyphomonadaceae bacterium]HPN05201.1 hypothetical protein [Hyphomonadaceae bacterium]
MKPWLVRAGLTKAGLASALALILAACATTPRAPTMTIDEIARAYVSLVLEIDAHESGYVDAFYGPTEWRDAARANPRERQQLKTDADALATSLRQIRASDPEMANRARVLLAQITSARFRLDMIDGKRVKFADEAERLFALRPKLKPLSSYDAALASIDKLIPGEGPLNARVESFRANFSIAPNRVRAVMDAAIAECRSRTRAHLDLPANESFDMALVKDKSWGAYNYYQGDNHSKIEINTDMPMSIGNVLILGCHEGYPGHHVQGIYKERNFRTRGWPEYSVQPLYAPESPLNEGGADFGVKLAFPGDEQVRFEAETLYPLAGLDPATAVAYDALRRAVVELEGALLTISQKHLDGEISREQAITLIQKYKMVPRDVAEQSLAFDRDYRSYVMNYSVGRDLVAAYVDRHGGQDANARWAAYEHILSTPVLPADLTK